MNKIINNQRGGRNQADIETIKGKLIEELCDKNVNRKIKKYSEKLNALGLSDLRSRSL